MAADQFPADAVDDIADVEASPFLGQLGVENDLKEEISQLLLKIPVISAPDGLSDLGGFFAKIFQEGTMGLFPVPRTAPLSAQASHEPDQIVEGILFSG